MIFLLRLFLSNSLRKGAGYLQTLGSTGRTYTAIVTLIVEDDDSMERVGNMDQECRIPWEHSYRQRRASEGLSENQDAHRKRTLTIMLVLGERQKRIESEQGRDLNLSGIVLRACCYFSQSPGTAGLFTGNLV